MDSEHFALPPTARKRIAPLDDASFERCAGFAEAKLGERLSIQEWASVLGMSPDEFARAFRKRMNVSPYAWFVGRRLEQAKHLLRTRELALAQIALETGFCSQSHFSATFRQRVGCTPAQWTAGSRFSP